MIRRFKDSLPRRETCPKNVRVYKILVKLSLLKNTKVPKSMPVTITWSHSTGSPPSNLLRGLYAVRPVWLIPIHSMGALTGFFFQDCSWSVKAIYLTAPEWREIWMTGFWWCWVIRMRWKNGYEIFAVQWAFFKGILVSATRWAPFQIFILFRFATFE